MNDENREPEDAPLGDTHGREGGKIAAGEPAGTRQQLDGAGGGYGSQSGTGSSGGTGDGDPGADSAMDDGTTTGSTGATGAGPTEWVRSDPTPD
jgi:hypothetical protein